jgi:large subunit ribosomal protein L5
LIMPNPMQEIYLDKVVLNMGIGASEEKLESAKQLLKKLTGHEAAYTKARRRLPEFGIKKGQIIGAVVTLRNEDALDILKRSLDANNNVLSSSCVANNSVNFGVKEYIYFSGVKYDPKIGMLGLNINAFFARKGFRVERRKIKRSEVGEKHKRITKEELLSYLEKNFGIKVVESER